MLDKRRWLPCWQRVELVQKCLGEGMTRREAAAWRRVSVSTVQYWIERYRGACDQDRASGAWAEDRPSVPHRQPSRCSEQVHDRVCEERRRTGWGPRLIASELGMSHATVSRCLARRGVSRAPKSPREAVRRFEWPCPGDLLQMDVKRFARFQRPGHRVTGDRYRSGKEKRARVGWEFAHSMIDDHSRLVYTELLDDEQAPDGHGLRAASAQLLRIARHHRQASADRQSLLLRQEPQPARAARPRRHPPPLHPTAHAQAQRQG